VFSIPTNNLINKFHETARFKPHRGSVGRNLKNGMLQKKKHLNLAVVYMNYWNSMLATKCRFVALPV
jgi:hypothetical protein